MKKLSLGRFLLISLFCLGQVLRALADDPIESLYYRFSGTSNALRGATYGNGLYVVVGDSGTILTSPDTITWLPQTSGTTNRLNSVRYGDSGFVAVGDSAPGTPSTILSSADGITWTSIVSPVTNRLLSVTFGLGRYVASGSKGMIVTSTNAINWTSIDTGAPYDLNGVAASVPFAPLFVTVGDSGTIATSPDGLAWTFRFSGTFSRLTSASILPGGSRIYLAAGESGTVLSSTDGATWTAMTSGTAQHLYGVANDALAQFGAVGAQGVFIVTPPSAPPSAATWTPKQSGSSNHFNAVTYANGNFIAVGNAGTIQAGVAWLPQNSGTSQSLKSAAYGLGQFVSAGGATIVTSSNGVNWLTRYLNANATLNGVTFGSNGFVAVGQFGMILTSTNGNTWANHGIPTTNDLYAVAYGNGVYVAIGAFFYNPGGSGFYKATTYRSVDGINWTGPNLPPIPAGFTGITFETNMFVAVAWNGNIVSSPDGQTWTSRASGVSYDLLSVAYGNGRFTAVGQTVGLNTQVTTSPDGTNWVAHNYVGLAPKYTGVVYGDLGFISISPSRVSSSSDGTSWAGRGLDDTLFMRSVTFGNGTYLLVGDNGKILKSTRPIEQARPQLAGTLTGSGFELTAIAQPGYGYRIQRTTSFSPAVWTDIISFTSTQAVTQFIDSTATNQSHGFYRAVSP
jgi:hypothetical protein